ncbi:MAG: hypothetical protein DMG34_16220 [Acidobacteria bacterium]|nr:MAG: hypothetical protein DMG34_16220 [Acidobacteriota bacterium]
MSVKFFASRSRMRDVSSVTVSERRSGCKLKVSWLMVVWRIALASERIPQNAKLFLSRQGVENGPYHRQSWLCAFPKGSRSQTVNRMKLGIGVAGLAALFICALPSCAQLSVGGKVETKKVLPPTKHVIEEVRSYRLANQDRIMRELREFLSIPNVASDTPNIDKNAARLKEMLEARGVETHLLSIEGRGPVVFGKLDTEGATRTVIFYAHYDGQPVDPAAWTDKTPFEPVLRDKSIEAGGKRISFPDAAGGTANSYQDHWRIYARSSSDDKSPIVAVLSSLDALHAKNIPLAVNLKFILEGEEEAGSAHLQKTLQLHKNLLGANLLITGDGPTHQSGRPLVFFGNRGDIGLDITVYGPARSLHSGHYGNWAPNPAMQLSRLLAAMKDEDGRVLIPGYYNDVDPLSPLEQRALNAMPVNDAELQRELGIAKPDGGSANKPQTSFRTGPKHRSTPGSLKVKIRKKSLHKSRHSFASRDSSSSITNPL